MINVKNKNNLILMISAAMIAVAILITCIATAVEHSKAKNKGDKTDTASTSSVVSTNDVTESTKDEGNVPGTYMVNTESSGLNIREFPDGDGFSEIPKGAKITVKAIYGDWGYVTYGEDSGWVAMKYTKLLTPSKKSPDHKPGKYTIATKETPLGIRSIPDDDGEWLLGIPKGTEVEILAVVDNWGYVEYNGTKGWLNFKYLK